MAINRMFSLTCFRKAFTPILWLSILALIVCLIFVRLGFWQIARSQEKKDMVLQQEKQKNNLPLIWKPGQELPSQYQPIQVSGKYLKNLFPKKKHYTYNNQQFLGPQKKQLVQ